MWNFLQQFAITPVNLSAEHWSVFWQNIFAEHFSIFCINLEQSTSYLFFLFNISKAEGGSMGYDVINIDDIAPRKHF